MYILGHTAFAYILIRPICEYFNLKLDPKIVLLILINHVYGIFSVGKQILVSTYPHYWIIFKILSIKSNKLN